MRPVAGRGAADPAVKHNLATGIASMEELRKMATALVRSLSEELAVALVSTSVLFASVSV